MAPHRNRKDLDVNLNLNVRGMTPSATVAINERCDELRRQNRRIFKLGLGQSPFPVPEPVVEKLRTNAFQKDYLPVKGLHQLRRAVADYHRRSQGLQFTWENVIVGPGSKELMFLLQLSYNGDIIIPTPSWVSYEPQARIVGRRIKYIHTSYETRWRPAAKDLDALCRRAPKRQRILILNYPSNPTGLTFSRGELEEIAAVARRYDIVILSDEIYAKTEHDSTHDSIVPLYPEGSIFSGGLSKWCGAGGWRLGVFVFPERLRWLQEAMAAVGTETYTSTSAPIQYAAVKAFEEGPEIHDYLLHSRRMLQRLGLLLAGRLRDAGARVYNPDGAFYLFPDFDAFRESLAHRGVFTSTQLCEALLEDTGVAMLPGTAFGRPEDELTIRMAYVDFDGTAAMEASRRIPLDERLDDAFVGAHFGRLVEALDRVCAWVEGSRT